MPSLKHIRRRIQTVKDTQKITKAMKMVAASKLRKAQDAIIAARPYAYTIRELIRRLTAESGYKHRLMIPHDEVKRVALVVLTSDRGLCGSFNSNIIRHAERFMKENAERYEKIELLCIGKKAVNYFKYRKVPIRHVFFDVFSDVTYERAEDIASVVVNMYMNGEVDEVRVVYNEFKSAISQKIVDEQLIPIEPLDEFDSPDHASLLESNHIYEPERKEIIDDLVERHITTQVLRCLLESIASEHGARMTAMDAATNNASEMIDKLTLTYNRIRQADITKEIMEIVGGAEALSKG